MQQRKVITALFCDLVGSTELSGALEPETLRSVVLRYFEAMRSGIESHGGTVEKFIGDAVMAVFGVPHVHEDDAHRAAAAALDMIAALDGLNAELDRDFGSTLAVRIGLNSGEIVTSPDLKDGTVASGEVVNVAARLEQAARPGQILVGPATRVLLGAAAVVESVGPLTLKGKREPVEAFRLLGLATEGGPPGVSRPGAPFVGHAREYDRLATAWTEISRDGTGRLVRLTGDAGIGKTRLLREWLAARTAEGALVGTGRCHSYRDEASLAPLADAIREVLRIANTDGTASSTQGPAEETPESPDPDEGAPVHADAEVEARPRTDTDAEVEARPRTDADAEVRAHLRAGPLLRLPAGAGSRPVSAPDDEAAYEVLRGGLLADSTPSPSAEATWTAAAAVLRGLAAARPVALALDELQWARPQLLLGVARLTEMLAGSRVLLVCSQRTGEDEPPVTADEIRLLPLSRAESLRLAAALATGHPDDGALEAVVERAEGNPLHLEQLLTMVEDGADPGELPVTVTAVLAARIDVLPGPQRAMLDAGAVIGRRFGVAEVRLLLDDAPADGAQYPRWEQAPLESAVRELVRRGLVEPAPGAPATYQFSSGLLRDVTYRALSKSQRASWHEQLAAGSETGAALAAHHLEAAYLHRRDLGLRGERVETLRGRAADTLSGAGRHALARADLSWSAELHARALSHCAPGEARWRRAAQGLGETWLALGRSDEGGDLLREVHDAASAAGDRLARAHAGLQLASLDPDASPGTAADAARSGLAVFTEHQDRLGLARAHVRLAQEQQYAGRHRAACDLLAVALHHAVAAGAAPERAMALGALGISLWHGPTPAGEAIERCRALLAEHGPGNPVVVVALDFPLANLLALSGRVDEARGRLAEAERFAAGLGYAEVAAFGPLFAAGVEVLAGSMQEAERLLRRAEEAFRAVGGPILHAAARRDLARVLIARGLPREAVRSGAGGGTAGPESTGVGGRGPQALTSDMTLSPADAADDFGVRALAAVLSGDGVNALRLVRRAVAVADTTDSPVGRATARLDMAQVLRGTGRPAAAGRRAKQAARLFRAKGHAVGVAAAAQLIAVTAETARDETRGGRATSGDDQ
ncbi:adenylate/guanylate cyclase domain-containing protein [Streptomyces fagopyri]|uniref:adenylate/guanylate cyclase domain-containing protein n=1 Tax=Streptomyces fagopyri TaxID=2662397 RepID=UPI0036966C1A